MELNLNYFKDMEDNYIIRRFCGDEEMSFFKCEGSSSFIGIMDVNCLNEELTKEIEGFCNKIENHFENKYKIKKENFLSEKIVCKILFEEEYNPLFQKISKTEALKLKGNSQKMKLEFKYEFHIPEFKPIGIRAFQKIFKNYIK